MTPAAQVSGTQQILKLEPGWSAQKLSETLFDSRLWTAEKLSLSPSTCRMKLNGRVIFMNSTHRYWVLTMWSILSTCRPLFLLFPLHGTFFFSNAHSLNCSSSLSFCRAQFQWHLFKESISDYPFWVRSSPETPSDPKAVRFPALMAVNVFARSLFCLPFLLSVPCFHESIASAQWISVD